MTTAVLARDGSETTGTAPARVHFGGFEILRAIAAVMVVVHHAGSYAGEARTGSLYTLTAVMDSGVAVFFVLSGYLLYKPFVRALLRDEPLPSVRRYFRHRLLRIVPLYWVVVVASSCGQGMCGTCKSTMLSGITPPVPSDVNLRVRSDIKVMSALPRECALRHEP